MIKGKYEVMHKLYKIVIHTNDSQRIRKLLKFDKKSSKSRMVYGKYLGLRYDQTRVRNDQPLDTKLPDFRDEKNRPLGTKQPDWVRNDLGKKLPRHGLIIIRTCNIYMYF